MLKEFDLLGIYLPPLFVYATATLVVWQLVRSVLLRTGGYRWIWHAPLFDMSLFVILLAAFVAALT